MNILKELRKQKGLKQSDVAELNDCTVRTIRRMESGEAKIPKLLIDALKRKKDKKK